MVLGPRDVARNRGLPADRPGGNPNYKSGDAPDSDDSGGSKPRSPKRSPSAALRLSMNDIQNKIGNLALTNTYYVNIALTDQLKTHFDKSYKDISKGGIQKFVDEKLGYLCSEATLPVSSYATAEVKDNYMGIPQEFAHTRLYTDVDMTFYVDSDYSVLRFFEGWMDYISGGNSSAKGEPAAGSDTGRNVYRRFVFPDFYKVQTMTIKKFERDFKRELTYTFINAFPKGLTAIPVSYGPADLLKVTVTFNFDRYIVERETAAQAKLAPSSTKIKTGRDVAIEQSFGGLSPAGSTFLDSFTKTGAGPGLDLTDFQDRA